MRFLILGLDNSKSMVLTARLSGTPDISDAIVFLTFRSRIGRLLTGLSFVYRYTTYTKRGVIGIELSASLRYFLKQSISRNSSQSLKISWLFLYFNMSI